MKLSSERIPVICWCCQGYSCDVFELRDMRAFWATRKSGPRASYVILQSFPFWCLSLFQKSEEPRFSHPTALPQQLPSQQLMSKDQDEQEELDFLFDEEMEQMDGRKNTFTAWSDEDSDYEIDDRDVNKILIVTQTPPYMRRHPGGDRTGNHTSRAKMSAELAKVINDGLFYYEQDLWTEKFEPEYSQIKVRLNHSLEQVPGVLVTCGEEEG